MSRERKITRTIEETKITVLTLNVVTAEPIYKDFYTTEKETDNNKILKKLKKMHDTDEIKLVSVVETETKTAVYEMSESDFIKYGTIRVDAEQTKQSN